MLPRGMLPQEMAPPKKMVPRKGQILWDDSGNEPFSCLTPPLGHLVTRVDSAPFTMPPACGRSQCSRFAPAVKYFFALFYVADEPSATAPTSVGRLYSIPTRHTSSANFPSMENCLISSRIWSNK